MTEEERRKLAEVRSPFRGEHPNKDIIAAFCLNQGITPRMMVETMFEYWDKTGLLKRNSEGK